MAHRQVNSDGTVTSRRGFPGRPRGRGLALALFCLLCWAAFFWGFVRLAHGADCSVLHDADERHMCRAVSQCLKSECEFIERDDTRQVCRNNIELYCKRKQ